MTTKNSNLVLFNTHQKDQTEWRDKNSATELTSSGEGKSSKEAGGQVCFRHIRRFHTPSHQIRAPSRVKPTELDTSFDMKSLQFMERGGCV